MDPRRPSRWRGAARTSTMDQADVTGGLSPRGRGGRHIASSGQRGPRLRRRGPLQLFSADRASGLRRAGHRPRAPTARSWCSPKDSAAVARRLRGRRRLRRHRLPLRPRRLLRGAGDDAFDSHVGGDRSPNRRARMALRRSQLEDIVRTPVAADETTAYVGDVSGHVTAVELSSAEVHGRRISAARSPER